MNIIYSAVFAAAVAVGMACAANAADIAKPEYTSDLTIWPNSASKANSDQWIIDSHDKIRKMQPRVLVINLANGLDREKADKMLHQLCAAVAESSRYHGYKDENAPVFLDYHILKYVDLQDPKPYPETIDKNCTRYPRNPNWKEGEWNNLAYKELYTDKFAEYIGIKDPDNPSHYLRLNELVDRGIIHELWLFAHHTKWGAPYECTEIKPVYDENFKRIKGEHRPSGNGFDPEEPWFGRSLRINFINCERGIGCNVESMSHAFEGTANSSVIPYFRKYFYEFAEMDLDKRYGLPFNSFYALWGEGKGVEYPDPHTAIVKDGDKQYKLENYVAFGGNVHFNPNGRFHYDLINMEPVMSTIEHYRMHDGPDDKDIAEPWTVQKFQQYKHLAPDCMGAWLVYWRQNVPGLDNKSKDDNGKPMKNWWPFLFY